MGRPPIELTEDQWAFLRVVSGVPKAIMTQEQIISAMRGLKGLERFSLSTLQRIIKDHFGDITFDQYRQSCMGEFRGKLLAKQYQKAISGSDRMLEWLGSNYMDQSSKSNIVQESTQHIIYDTQFGDGSTADGPAESAGEPKKDA